MKKLRLLAILNLVFLLIHIFISYSTQFKLLNNKDVGEVSSDYPSLFTPAGITFAIWGLIYLALFAFAIYHIIQTYRKPADHSANVDLVKIGPWFIINSVATSSWLIVWTNEWLLFSVTLIFIQLISLIIINLRLNIYAGSRELQSKLFTQFPISIYFAWITIATIANTSSYLAALGFSAGLDAITWTVIMISIAVLITVMVVLLRKNIFYGLVVIWALYGIVLKRTEAGNEQAIINTAWAGLVATSVVCIVQLIRNANVQRGNHVVSVNTKNQL